MRLNKYIARAGITSRRRADELIKNGNVKINGSTAKELGISVNPGDLVEVNGRIVESSDKLIYIMLNKPKGCVTTMSDDRGRLTVADLVSDIDARIFPVGRLDCNTTGLLIMTNDGDMAHKLTHPRHEVTKTYRALVGGTVSKERISMLRRGVDIGGFVTSEARVEIIKRGSRGTVVEIEIKEGKNRQIRKMFATVGNDVLELRRTAVGCVHLGHLMEGHYRKLKSKEVEYLKKCGFQSCQ